jgi:hypothetical protein
MAGANTLRPIVMAPTSSELPVRRGKFGLFGTAAWLCLAGMGSSQPILHAASSVHASGASCLIAQKTPLYVGVFDRTAYDSFGETALASRNIVREVRHWACGASTSLSVAVPSLQLAFARGAALRLDRMQFDDSDMVHAHVVLSSTDTVTQSGPQHWRIELTQAPERGWTVTGTDMASAQDLVVP